MPRPAYFDEKRYSYHVLQPYTSIVADYVQADPATAFEMQVRDSYNTAYGSFTAGQFAQTLAAFQQLQNLILTMVHPTLPPTASWYGTFQAPNDAALVGLLAAKAGQVLTAQSPAAYAFPSTVVSAVDGLPADVASKLQPFENAGIALSPWHVTAGAAVGAAGAAAAANDWAGAVQHYNDAVKLIPDTAPLLKAAVLHDLAIATEKSGGTTQASVSFVQQSADLFGQASAFAAQAEALTTLAGIQDRSGDAAGRDASLAAAGKLQQDHRLFPVGLPAPVTVAPIRTIASGILALRSTAQPTAAAQVPITAVPVPITAVPAPIGIGPVPVAPPPPAGTIPPPQLIAAQYFATVPTERTYTMVGALGGVSIGLTADVTKNVTGFLQSVSQSADIQLLHNLVGLLNPVETAAYLASMYFYTIPMAIGDCLLALGNLEEAASTYASVLVYPYINLAFEIPKLWTKLAQVYLEMGDRDYRNAGATVADFAAAKADYEHIVKTDGTLDGTSVLYADARFAPMKARVTSFVQSGYSATFADNPQVTAKVLEAHIKLSQIAAGFDYFGFAPDYLPPFGWQYLQTTAKYFAQQASQIEQRYIQYTASGEQETLERQQLDQQAQVAAQTVVLEQRGVAEAQATVAVAQAGLNYANVQEANAHQAQAEFAAVRDQLAEYGELEAWANAASVDQGSEVSLTISGYTYYNVSGQRRSIVIQDLEARRTKISQDLEASRLQRDLNAATAYADQAQAEVNDAQARVAIAQQRVALAQLQQRDAEENRDYLDMKELNARLWFDLARSARRISQRYTEMATSIALLAQRAYNAETGRAISVIRYDYAHSSTDNLMGADFLGLDLDFLTLDYLTTTKTKRAPVKRIISLADWFPVAFHSLQTTGHCTFQTELAMFDRQAPGMYLTKIRNVELVFVGVTNASVAGTLRNIGGSRFRQADGTVVTRLYPPDVMPLSAYELRQDALAFRVNPNELQLFENNGIDTMWQLDLPLDANDLDLDAVIDVQMVLYYDGFFDAGLEATVRAGLPTSGSATRVTSMRLTFPDELYFLRGQGQAQLTFDESLFPRTQKNLMRTKTSLRISGDAVAINGLKMHLHSAVLGTDLVVTTDANGMVAGAVAADPLGALIGHPVFDQLGITIQAGDNPQLVTGGQLDLSGIRDLMIYLEYSFDYR